MYTFIGKYSTPMESYMGLSYTYSIGSPFRFTEKKSQSSDPSRLAERPAPNPRSL